MFDWDDVGIFCIVCLVVLLIVAVVLVNQPILTEGEVIDKEFTPAHATSYTSSVRAGKVSVPVVRKVHHPDTWRINVSGISDKGNIKTEWWTVSEEVYNSVEIGDNVERNPETDDVFKVEDGEYE